MKKCPYDKTECNDGCVLYIIVRGVKQDKEGMGHAWGETPTCKKFGPVGPTVYPK